MQENGIGWVLLLIFISLIVGIFAVGFSTGTKCIDDKDMDCLQGDCTAVCERLNRNNNYEYDLWLKHCKE